MELESRTNSFYKNENASVESTDLVATKRFKDVLLNEELKVKPDSSNKSVPSNVAPNSESAPIPATKPALKPAKNSVLNRISMFESSNPDYVPSRNLKSPTTTAPRYRKFAVENIPNKDSVAKPENEIELAITARKDRFKNYGKDKFGSSSAFGKQDIELKKSILTETQKKPILEKKTGSQIETQLKPKKSVKTQKKLQPQPQPQPQQQPDLEPEPQPEKKVERLVPESKAPEVLNVFASPFRLSKYRDIPTAFSHHPVYNKVTLLKLNEKPDQNLRTKASTPALTRTNTSSSVISERPLMAPNNVYPSNASIAGSVMSEKPLCDFGSEIDIDEEPLYNLDNKKSSSSVMSDSLFDSTETATSVPAVFTSIESRNLKHDISVDQKLSDFAYLFKISENETLDSSKIIASSSVRSNLDEIMNQSTDRSTIRLVSGDTTFRSKGSNTVRFNEEVTEYETPFAADEEEGREGEDEDNEEEIYTGANGTEVDEEDDDVLEAEDQEILNNLEKLEGTEKYIEKLSKQKSVTKSVIKRALIATTVKSANANIRNSMTGSTTSLPEDSMISRSSRARMSSEDYQHYEEFRNRRRSQYNSLTRHTQHASPFADLYRPRTFPMSASPLQENNTSHWTFLRKLTIKRKSVELVPPGTHDRPVSAASSRVSFISSVSKINQRISSALGSRKALPEAQIIEEQSIHESRANSPESSGNTTEISDTSGSSNRVARKSLKSIGTHFVKNLSSLSINKKDSQPESKTKKRTKYSTSTVSRIPESKLEATETQFRKPKKKGEANFLGNMYSKFLSIF